MWMFVALFLFFGLPFVLMHRAGGADGVKFTAAAFGVVLLIVGAYCIDEWFGIVLYAIVALALLGLAVHCTIHKEDFYREEARKQQEEFERLCAERDADNKRIHDMLHPSERKDGST